jgi:hypothetical protein
MPAPSASGSVTVNPKLIADTGPKGRDSNAPRQAAGGLLAAAAVVTVATARPRGKNDDDEVPPYEELTMSTTGVPGPYGTAMPMMTWTKTPYPADEQRSGCARIKSFLGWKPD